MINEYFWIWCVMCDYFHFDVIYADTCTHESFSFDCLKRSLLFSRRIRNDQWIIKINVIFVRLLLIVNVWLIACHWTRIKTVCSWNWWISRDFSKVVVHFFETFFAFLRNFPLFRNWMIFPWIWSVYQEIYRFRNDNPRKSTISFPEATKLISWSHKTHFLIEMPHLSQFFAKRLNSRVYRAKIAGFPQMHQNPGQTMTIPSTVRF